jgi:SAM-dependent methyltransferase
VRADLYRDYSEIEDRHWWSLGRRAIFLRILDRDLPSPPDGSPRSILDIGCGAGAMLRELERYGRAQGLDSAPEAVRLCRERGVSDVRLATPPPLPYDSGSFDLVTALDVLEHIEDDDRMVSEVSRILRPGGCFLLSVPAYRFLWGLQDEVSHHQRRYIGGEVRELLNRSGLAVRRLTYFNSLLFPIIASVRLTRRLRRTHPSVESDFDLTRPGRLNDVLARVLASERYVIDRVNLPFGVSILALAFKPGESPRQPRRYSLRRRRSVKT